MHKLNIARLTELVIAADRETLCQEMAPLSEAERAELAPAALQLVAHVETYCNPFNKQEIPPEAQELAAAIAAREYPDWRCPRWTAQLLLIGLCDLGVIKHPHKFGAGWGRSDLRDMQQRVLQILQARRPKWLAEWLKWERKDESPIAGWYLQRGLIRCGAVPEDDTPEYYARMAVEDRVIQSEFMEMHDTLPLFKSRREMLEADPELFQRDIWRLFEVDTAAFRYAHLGWPDLLIELSQSGRLERAKLLEKCVHGMSLPLSVTTLGGLVKFHDQLSPSITERQSLLAGYLRLLHQNHPGVVALAIHGLEKLHGIQQLPVAEFAQHLPAVFTLEKKGAVKAALKLADAMIWHYDQPESRLRIGKAIVGGLQHPAADIQRATVESLRWIDEIMDDDLRDQLAHSSDTVASVVQPELKKLLAKLGGASPAPPVVSSSKVSDQPSLNLESSDTWSDIPDPLRQRSHLNAALQAWRSGAPPVVLPVAKHHPPRRDPARTVMPIADMDELIATVTAVMHRVDDAMQLERCLDGILRLHATPPDDFQKRSGALHKAVTKRLEKYASAGDMLFDIGFMTIVATWLKIPVPTYHWFGWWFEMRYWFLRARCVEVLRMLGPKAGLPLLALPTHADGWLDPEVLVARINDHYAARQESPRDNDLAQALLRLTPDGRAAALQQLKKPDYYNGGIELRYALGDDVQPHFNRSDAVVQLAAVRARMISLAETGYQPALPIAQAYLDQQQRLVVGGALTEDPSVPFSLWERALSTEPICLEVLDPQHPYAWRDSWEALTNPLENAADCLAGRTSHLLDPESTWTPEACRLAVLAASHDRHEARIATTDAMIEAIARLLIIPEVMGRALAETLHHIKLNRVAKVLTEAARPGPLHHWVVLQSLESSIAQLTTLPADIHLLLTQMHESASLLAVGLSQTTLDKLSELDAKSKSGKLARQLQKLTTTDPTAASLHAEIIAATAARARRWQVNS